MSFVEVRCTQEEMQEIADLLTEFAKKKNYTPQKMLLMTNTIVQDNMVQFGLLEKANENTSMQKLDQPALAVVKNEEGH